MTFGFDMRSAARCGRGRNSGVPDPAAGGLPAAAALVVRWSADAIPPLPDGSLLAVRTDAEGGIAAAQSSAAARLACRTGGANGKPYVLFGGDQLLNAGADNTVATACRSGTSTVMVVRRTIAATGFGFLFTATPFTGDDLFHNGSEAGFFGSGLQRAPYAGTGLTTLWYAGGTPDPTLGRAYLNATCLNAQGNIASAAGERVALGGSAALSLVGVKAEIYEVIAWNRALSAAEVMRAELWVCARYASPLPWAGGPFRVFHGDSITSGSGSTTALANYPARVAARNGWPIGTWTNLGHGGQPMAGLRGEAIVDIDPMVALLGATPRHLAAWEWFNQRSAFDPLSETVRYFQARRAVGFNQLVLATSTDAADLVESGTLAKRAA